MPEKLTLKEIAEHYGISTKTLRKRIRSAQVPYVRFGRALRFDLATVEAHLAAKDEVITLPRRRVSVGSKGGNKYAEALGV
jgi:excisionase family DNA binding protein